MMKQQKKTNYSNLLPEISQQEEETGRDYTKVDKALRERYQEQAGSTANYIRQSISVTRKEVQLGRELQRKLASSDEIVNRSQLYRTGLAVLQTLKTTELIGFLKKLTA